MTKHPKPTPTIFQDPGVTGFGRVSATIQHESVNRITRRRIDCYALVYILSGEGHYEDEYGTAGRISGGDAFLLFPDVTHSYSPDPGTSWHEQYILFEGPLFDLWRKHGMMDPAHPLYSLRPVSYWGPRVLSVWKDRGTALDRVIRLQALLAEMSGTRADEGVDVHEKEWLERARRTLVRHAFRRGAAQEAAREMGMSYQTFRKTFSRLDGRGPARYATEQAVEAAARRLLSERTPIKELAEELGFSDEFHFSKRFKQHLGISPAAYRRRLHHRLP